MNTCTAVLEPIREMFYEPNNSYAIYACNLVEEVDGDIKLNRYDNVIIVGTMPKVDLYKQYTFVLKEGRSKKYNDIQYEFISMEREIPKSTDDQIIFFNTILTPLQIKNIFKVYDKPLDEFINNTFDYNKVKGFGAVTYERVKKKVLENYVLFDLLSQLYQYGITYGQVLKLYNKYKNVDLILQKINNDPYILMELDGIGFLKADKIALNMGILKNDIRRINACVLYILELEENSGHIWADINILKDKVLELTGNLDGNDFIDIISEHEKLIIVDDYKVATKFAYNTEKEIAYYLNRLENSENIFKENKFNNIDDLNKLVEEFIEQQEIQQGFKYNKEQKQSFYNMINNNVSVIVGYAGSGKSTTVNGILNLLDKLMINYILFSPTARACKVLRDYTGRDAFTYERGLCWNPNGFLFNEYNPLPFDVLVSDEMSMVGIYRFLDMLKALKDGTKLMLVGDSAQLESVSVGCILEDVVNSNKFVMTELTEVHRQAKDSGIIELATKTRLNEMFINNNETKIKCFGVKKDAVIIPGKKEVTVRNIIQTYKKLLVKDYKPEDIAVILPMKKGESGVRELNRLLQEINNAQDDDKNEIEYGKVYHRVYRENDRVINIQNDYNIKHYNQYLVENGDVGIINGDIGSVYKIYKEKNEDYIAVLFDDYVILYSKYDLNVLEHSWAFTCHKAQGGQFPVVIFGFDSRHNYMAKRSLLYTAETRAKDLLVICGDPVIINKAIKNNEVLYKRTFLKDFLVNNIDSVDENDNFKGRKERFEDKLEVF